MRCTISPTKLVKFQSLKYLLLIPAMRTRPGELPGAHKTRPLTEKDERALECGLTHHGGPSERELCGARGGRGWTGAGEAQENKSQPHTGHGLAGTALQGGVPKRDENGRPPLCPWARRDVPG